MHAWLGVSNDMLRLKNITHLWERNAQNVQNMLNGLITTENLLIDEDDKNVKHLYRTIIKSYSEQDLTRANEQENGPGFRNYTQFCKYQIYMLRLKIHNDHFDWILSKIHSSEIRLTNKENNVEFKMSGFYYNSCEDIVFFNER